MAEQPLPLAEDNLPADGVRREGISRRSLLALGAVLVAGAAWPVARGLGSETLPDGPVLPPLADLPALPWTADPDGALAGVLVAAPAGSGLAYNATTPGPLLRLREGDRVRLRFRNDTADASSLHLHGLPLTPAVDAPLAHLMPGDEDVREFTVPAGSAGTHWYHPHAHGDVERQILAGLTGPIVVTGPADERPELAQAGDHLLAVTRSGADLLVGGRLRPVMYPRSGRTRLRLLNATAGDSLRFAVTRDGAPATVHLIATDAGLVKRPVALREVLLPPGGRAEVLVETTRRGRLEVRALPHSPYGPGGEASADTVLASLDVPTSSAAVPLPAALAPVEHLDPVTAVTTRRIELDANDAGGFTIDGRPFAMDRVDVSARLGTLEVWEVVNRHSMEHPFHLHSYPVQVLDVDGVAEPYRAWRDTVTVPPGSTVRLAIPFRGAPGRTVYHCHIANHEDLGMMGVLEVRP